ncbi:putative aminopeptidase [Helianthus annuus]|nr:putative aminopeptidase [Helianthus annuus]KAJ0673718.1 putative aminopeptidase [Helianthus annuus]KAJ0861363.1 putative aminopeptidase [Helianthus annuus]
MDHVVTKPTLGLTHPAQIDHPKVPSCPNTNLDVVLKPGVNLCEVVLKKFILFAAKETDLVEWKGDILAIGVTEKDMTKDKNIKFEDFTRKAGQSTVIRVSGLGSKRVSLIGLGNGPTDPSSYRVLGESVASAAKAS